MNISSRHNIQSLSDRNEINLIFSKGKKLATKYGPIFLYKKKNEEYIKIAILLKKNIGNAVRRNYLKRIIRYFIQKHRLALGNYNRIIFLFNSGKPVNYSLLEKEYIRALQK